MYFKPTCGFEHHVHMDSLFIEFNYAHTRMLQHTYVRIKYILTYCNCVYLAALAQILTSMLQPSVCPHVHCASDVAGNTP